MTIDRTKMKAAMRTIEEAVENEEEDAEGLKWLERELESLSEVAGAREDDWEDDDAEDDGEEDDDIDEDDWDDEDDEDDEDDDED